MKDKIVVLDTNVLLHDPEAPHRFGDLRVVIPMQVVEEIDRFKKDHSEKGRNARRISRLLDSYRARGSLADGVPIEGTNHGMLQVIFCQAQALQDLPAELQGGGGDNNILAVALEQMRCSGLKQAPEVVLISKDINLRIKADAVGLQAEDYVNDNVSIDDLYTGFRELSTDAETIRPCMTRISCRWKLSPIPRSSIFRPMKVWCWWISTTTATPCWPGIKATATSSSRCTG